MPIEYAPPAVPTLAPSVLVIIVLGNVCKFAQIPNLELSYPPYPYVCLHAKLGV